MSLITVRTGEEVPNYSSIDSGSAALLARAISWIKICADLNARVCASYKLALYRKAGKSGNGKRLGKSAARIQTDPRRVGIKAAGYADSVNAEIEEVMDHPVLDLLNDPNPLQMRTEYETFAFQQLELMGNWFEYVHDEGSGPVETYSLMGQYVIVVPSSDNLIGAYRYVRNNVEPHDFEPEEINHVRYQISLVDPYRGESWVSSVLREADLNAMALQSELRRWQNGGQPGMVWELPSEATTKHVESFREDLRRQASAVSGAGKTVVVRGAKLVQYGAKPHEMNYGDGMDRVAKTIWNAAGIPETLLKLSDSNLASAAHGNPQYIKHTIEPRLRVMAEARTELMLRRFGVEPGEMWFSYVLDDFDAGGTATNAMAMYQGSLITLNEARAEIGRDPVDGGDMFHGQQPATPEPEEPQVEEEPEPEDAEEHDEQDGEADSEADALKSVYSMALDAASGKLPIETAKALASQCLCKHCGDVSGLVDAVFSPIVRKAEEQTHDQKTEEQGHSVKSLDDAADHPAVVTQIQGDFAKALEAWHRQAVAEALSRPGELTITPDDELRSIIDGFLKRIMQEGGNAALGQVGVAGSFELASPGAVLFLEKYGLELARSVTGTLAAELRTEIAAQVGAGGSVADISRALLEKVPERSGYWAERIARTETSLAYEAAGVEAWKGAGYAKKQRILAGGPCPVCEAAQAKYPDPIPIDQAYYLPGDVIVGSDGTLFTVTRIVMGANIHPNCRCTLTAVKE